MKRSIEKGMAAAIEELRNLNKLTPQNVETLKECAKPLAHHILQNKFRLNKNETTMSELFEQYIEGGFLKIVSGWHIRVALRAFIDIIERDFVERHHAVFLKELEEFIEWQCDFVLFEYYSDPSNVSDIKSDNELTTPKKWKSFLDKELSVEECYDWLFEGFGSRSDFHAVPHSMMIDFAMKFSARSMAKIYPLFGLSVRN